MEFVDPSGTGEFRQTTDPATQNRDSSEAPVVIISDTHGYNFEPYMMQLTDQLRAKWYSVIPDSARQGQKGRVVVVFSVLRDGTVQDVRIVTGSGTESFDKASNVAVAASSPFYKLPADFSDDRIVVQATFLYNTR